MVKIVCEELKIIRKKIPKWLNYFIRYHPWFFDRNFIHRYLTFTLLPFSIDRRTLMYSLFLWIQSITFMFLFFNQWNGCHFLKCIHQLVFTITEVIKTHLQFRKRVCFPQEPQQPGEILSYIKAIEIVSFFAMLNWTPCIITKSSFLKIMHYFNTS